MTGEPRKARAGEALRGKGGESQRKVKIAGERMEDADEGKEAEINGGEGGRNGEYGQRETGSEGKKGGEAKSASVLEINKECDKLWSRKGEGGSEGADGDPAALLVSRVQRGDRGNG